MRFASWPGSRVCHIDPDRVMSVDAPEEEARFCYVSTTNKRPFLPPGCRLVFRVAGSTEEVIRLLGRTPPDPRGE